MSKPFADEITQFLEQQIVFEEKKYIEALKADAEFHVLKSIRQRINKLKAELSEAREIFKNSSKDDNP